MRKYTAQNQAHWLCCVNHSYPHNPKEWPKLGVGGWGKTRAQTLPLACFYIANNLRIFWLLSRVEKIPKEEEYFVIHGNYIKFKYHWPQIKFYWHTALLICLRSACGCFHTTEARLCSSDRDHMACRAETIYSPALCRRRLPTPDLINYWTKVASQVIINQLFVSCEYKVLNKDSISEVHFIPWKYWNCFHKKGNANILYDL